MCAHAYSYVTWLERLEKDRGQKGNGGCLRGCWSGDLILTIDRSSKCIIPYPKMFIKMLFFSEKWFRMTTLSESLFWKQSCSENTFWSLWVIDDFHKQCQGRCVPLCFGRGDVLHKLGWPTSHWNPSRLWMIMAPSLLVYYHLLSWKQCWKFVRHTTNKNQMEYVFLILPPLVWWM